MRDKTKIIETIENIFASIIIFNKKNIAGKNDLLIKGEMNFEIPEDIFFNNHFNLLTNITILKCCMEFIIKKLREKNLDFCMEGDYTQIEENHNNTIYINIEDVFICEFEIIQK